eukprot:1433276-Rhodomonas_salina.1
MLMRYLEGEEGCTPNTRLTLWEWQTERNCELLPQSVMTTQCSLVSVDSGTCRTFGDAEGGGAWVRMSPVRGPIQAPVSMLCLDTHAKPRSGCRTMLTSGQDCWAKFTAASTGALAPLSMTRSLPVIRDGM